MALELKRLKTPALERSEDPHYFFPIICVGKLRGGAMGEISDFYNFPPRLLDKFLVHRLHRVRDKNYR